jgi:AmiR/NasT family two-component response regulator
MQMALDIAVERFSQYRDLQAAFAGRAIIEQAKGILMARNGVSQDRAFELLRDHARSHSQKVVHVAEAIVVSHLLLIPESGRPTEPADSHGLAQ